MIYNEVDGIGWALTLKNTSEGIIVNIEAKILSSAEIANARVILSYIELQRSTIDNLIDEEVERLSRKLIKALSEERERGLA